MAYPQLYRNLTRYYKLNEASGSRAEAMANETLTDNNTVGSNTGHVYPLAASFVKASVESLSRADNATLSLGGDVAFSWMFWLNLPDVDPNSGGNTKPIVAKWSAASTEYELDIATSGQIRFLVRNAANTAFASASVAITANAWHMLAVIHDAASNLVGISIDGGSFVTGALTGGLRDSTNSFRIGGNDSGGAANSTDGLIGPIGLWRGYVFTDGDVDDLWNGGAGLTLEDMAYAVAEATGDTHWGPERVFGEVQIAGTSTVSADPVAPVQLSSQITGEAAVAASVVGKIFASATVAGSSALSSQTHGKIYASASIEGSSSVVANTLAPGETSALIEGTSALDVTAFLIGRARVEIANTSVVIGAIIAIGRVSASIFGTSTLRAGSEIAVGNAMAKGMYKGMSKAMA